MVLLVSVTGVGSELRWCFWCLQCRWCRWWIVGGVGSVSAGLSVVFGGVGRCVCGGLSIVLVVSMVSVVSVLDCWWCWCWIVGGVGGFGGGLRWWFVGGVDGVGVGLSVVDDRWSQ